MWPLKPTVLPRAAGSPDRRLRHVPARPLLGSLLHGTGAAAGRRRAARRRGRRAEQPGVSGSARASRRVNIGPTRQPSGSVRQHGHREARIATEELPRVVTAVDPKRSRTSSIATSSAPPTRRFERQREAASHGAVVEVADRDPIEREALLARSAATRREGSPPGDAQHRLGLAVALGERANASRGRSRRSAAGAPRCGRRGCAPRSRAGDPVDQRRPARRRGVGGVTPATGPARAASRSTARGGRSTTGRGSRLCASACRCRPEPRPSIDTSAASPSRATSADGRDAAVVRAWPR